MARTGSWPGILFLLSVLALCGLAVADLAYVSDAHRSGYDHGGFHANAERAVLAQSVVMEPGDRLVLQPNLLRGGWPTFERYAFYVVPGGDRFALLDGEAPRATYLRIDGMRTQACCSHGWVHWDRPDDEWARREGAPPVAAGPGRDVTQRELEMAGADQPERIDLVWLLDYGPNATRPRDAAEERAFAARMGAELDGTTPFHPAMRPAYPTVYEAEALSRHPLMEGTMAALALVAAGSAVAWTLRLRRARVDGEGPGTESLLRLYDSAGAYLSSLRDLLLASLVVTLGVALHVAILGEPEVMYDLLGFAGIGEGTRLALHLALGALYAVTVAVWAYAVWSVHRALRRWRRRRATPPLDLDDARAAP